MSITDGFADVAGTAIHYVEAGDGPPVVLLHGFPEFWFSWRHQLPALAANGFRAIAPDLPGYNRSSKPRDLAAYAMPEVARVMAEFMTATAATPCALVAHDWGAMVAWFVAMLHPEVVDRLVIMNAPHPVPYLREVRRSLEQKLRVSYQLFFQPPWLPEFLMRRFRFLMLRQLLLRSGRFTAHEMPAYIEAWRRDGVLTGMANYYRALRRIRGSRDLVRPIEVPVLMIWGERDPVFMRATTERFEEWAPNLRIERIARAGHFVQTDAADRVNELLTDFLKR